MYTQNAIGIIPHNFFDTLSKGVIQQIPVQKIILFYNMGEEKKLMKNHLIFHATLSFAKKNKHISAVTP